MTNITEQFPLRRRQQTVPRTAEPTTDNTAISPQDFYRELTEREDVQRILTRLAQIKDGHA